MQTLTLTASLGAPISVYYCKAGIQTGETIRVLVGSTVYQTAAVDLLDVRATMEHNNSAGRAKKSGARCVLILTAGTIRFSVRQ
jgi:hypothetical protein